jgi:bifunctional non-homologous end joining protein LigD
MPDRSRPIEPMLAREARALPPDDGWAFEIKWDGVRAIADGSTDPPRLQSRRGESLARRYPELVGLLELLGARGAIVDGEIVALDQEGRPSFQLLQRRMGLTSARSIERRTGEVPVSFIAFDLLALDGRDLSAEPYERRRELLLELGLEGECWRTPGHHVGEGPALQEAARRQGLEGIVAKRLGSPYRRGVRSGDWLKLRNRLRGDFLIGGWLGGEGGRSGRIGSLLLGIWNQPPQAAASAGEPQRLVYAGSVGSGLAERSIDQLEELLAPLRRAASPFEFGVGPKRPDPVFCEPQLVCAVEFSEWTREGTLRQPAYKGLRDDVDPRSVVREEAGQGQDLHDLSPGAPTSTS